MLLISRQGLDIMSPMSVPAIGESYRGVEGHSSYLLRQAWQALSGAMEMALRPHGLTTAQYGVLATLERESLIERRPHPTHGRILQATLTSEGRRRLEAAHPSVRALRRAIERDLSSDEIATVKSWLVTTAQRLERATESRAA